MEWKQIGDRQWECEDGDHLYRIGQSLLGYFVLGRSRRGKGNHRRRWITDHTYPATRHDYLTEAMARAAHGDDGAGGEG